MSTTDDIVSAAVSINQALHDSAEHTIKKNALMHFSLQLEACDEKHREPHHGSGEVNVDFIVPMYKASSVGRRICATPNLSQYFKKEKGTFFSALLTVSLSTPVSFGTRNEYNFIGVQRESESEEIEIVNALETDEYKDWTINLIFDSGHNNVLKEILFHHTPSHCPTLITLLEREATYIEEERLLAIIEATSKHHAAPVVAVAPEATVEGEASTEKKRKH